MRHLRRVHLLVTQHSEAPTGLAVIGWRGHHNLELRLFLLRTRKGASRRHRQFGTAHTRRSASR
jgi:hypothetical protein